MRPQKAATPPPQRVATLGLSSTFRGVSIGIYRVRSVVVKSPKLSRHAFYLPGHLHALGPAPLVHFLRVVAAGAG